MLASALSHSGVSLRQGGLSSLIPAVASTVGIYPDSFLIRRCYHTFANKLCDLHTLKHVYRFIKQNRLTIKSLNVGLFRPAVRHTILKNLIKFSYINLSAKVSPGREAKY